MTYYCGYYKPSKGFCVDTITVQKDLTRYLMEKYYGEDWFMDENFSIEEIDISLALETQR